MRSNLSWRHRYVSLTTSLVVGLLACLPGFAQSLSQIAPPSVSRVRGAIIDSQVVTLKGHVHPLAKAQFDKGVVPDGTAAEHVILMLQRSPQQEAAAAVLLDQLHNRNSPMFHQWLTAEEFGANFGPTTGDIGKLTAWLQQKGFKIEDVPPGRTHITISGTAGQMRQAFGAEFHNLNVNGEHHVAVLKDPTIPAALAPIVRGFRQLHDWGPKPNLVGQSVHKKDQTTGAWEKIMGPKSVPEFTFSYSGYTNWDVSPQDWYTIYNANPVYTAGVTGAGVTIAVLEETEVVNQSDIASFRSAFGLPAYPGTPDGVLGGVNWVYGPGNGCTAPPQPTSVGEEGEALLDTEWAGAIAPNAIVDFVACNSTGSGIGTYGTDLAAAYVANYLFSTVSATSLSYGECEISAGSSGVTFYANTWQQMAAEGITATVSAGDAGSAGCDQNAAYQATNLSTNAMSSSPYNISAGGTDFSDSYQVAGATPSAYWSATNGTSNSSALSYIPEISWGSYCANPLFASYLQAVGYTGFGTTYTPEYICNSPYGASYLPVAGGSGGISQYNAIPSWQSVYGVGAGTVSSTNRNEPDISFFASAGWWSHAVMYCQSDAGFPCTYTNSQDAYYQSAGGTSFVAPAITGMMGLINQKYGRQGVANYTLYNLAAQEYGPQGTASGSIANCSGSALGAGVGSTCIFNDVANDTPCLAGTAMCGTANTGFSGTGPGSGALNATSISSDIVQACKYSLVTNCYRALSTDTYGLSAVGNNTSTPAYRTAQGYDLATGLGSVNVSNLVNNWTNVSSGFATTTTLVAAPTALSISTPSTVLTATVVATGRGGAVAATGLVNFYLGSTGGTLLGTGTLTPTCTGAPGSGSCSASASLTLNGDVLPDGSDNIIAYFPGDGANDAPSTSPAVAVSVTRSSQSITFPNPGTQLAGTASLNLTATASSGLPVTYTVISGPATVSGSVLTITGSGPITVEADQAGGIGTWYDAAAPVQDTFSVNAAPVLVTITWATPAAITYPTALSGTQLDATATYGGNPVAGNFVYTPAVGAVLDAGPQTLSVTFTPANTLGYASATQTVVLQVNVETQTISFPAIPSQVAGATVALSATATSGLPVSFVSTTPTVCTVSGTTATMNAIGSCGIVASQAGNNDVKAAPSVGHTFYVAGVIQIIAFPAIPSTSFSAGTVTLTATASSGLAVTYTSATPAVCSVSGSTVSLLAVGNCGIVAHQAGNTFYLAAPAVGRNFTITGATQTINFPNPGDQTYGTPLTLVATATSGLPVSFKAATPAICSVSGTTATMINSGVCTIQATQAGSSTWIAATPVLQSFTVHHELQTLNFPAIPTQLLSTGTVALSATASSGLPVTFASSTSTVCTVSGTTATLLAGGTCTITATQAGNGGWAPIAQPRSFTVQLSSQTISFSPLSDLTLGVGTGTETLTASATSGLPVSLASTTPATCTVSGTTVTAISSGGCTVQATQPGNSNWLAAPPVSQSFTVHHEAQTVTFAVIPTQSLSGDAGTLALSATASSGLAVTFSSSTPAVCTVSGNTATLLTTGTCSILATQAGNGVYSAAAQPRSFTIVP